MRKRLLSAFFNLGLIVGCSSLEKPQTIYEPPPTQKYRDAFEELTPERQEELRDRYRDAFEELTPERQKEIRDGYRDAFEELTPERQKEIRDELFPEGKLMCVRGIYTDYRKKSRVLVGILVNDGEVLGYIKKHPLMNRGYNLPLENSLPFQQRAPDYEANTEDRLIAFQVPLDDQVRLWAGKILASLPKGSIPLELILHDPLPKQKLAKKEKPYFIFPRR